MMEIVISSDRNNLEKFLQNKTEAFFYVAVDLYSSEIEKFLKTKKYTNVDINERVDIDFGKEYVDFIGRINCDYNSIYWWANTISCKGSHITNLRNDIFNYYCLVSLIKQQDRSYILLSSNPMTNDNIARYCHENGIVCTLLDRTRKEGSLVHFRRCVLSAFCFLCNGWMCKTLALIYLSAKMRRVIRKDKSYCVIKTWIKDASFSGNNQYLDSYFGSLPEYLKQKRIDFFILGGILADYRDLIFKLRRVHKFLVTPLESFVGYLDYLKVIALAFFNRPKITKPIIFCGLEVTNFLKQCLRKDYEHNEIGKNLLYYHLTKQLLKSLKVNVFIYTFENRAWERMLVLAIRKYSPSTEIMGYAHSPPYPYYLEYRYSKEEENIVPLPDKIVTMGRELTDILKMMGNYKNSIKFAEGGSLRYEYLFKRGKIDWNRNGNMLAALSMNIDYSLKLLRFLCDAFGGSCKHKIVLRSHPFTPVELIIKKYNLRLSNNFKISNNMLPEDDLKDSSLVFYTNTTLGMEALMYGVPVVYIDIKEPISIDPLFKLKNLKWTVSTKQEIYKAIDHIYNMEEDTYLNEYNQAVAYLKNYFYPSEEKYLKQFLQSI